MITAVRIIGSFIAIAIGVVGAAMTFSFGLTFAEGFERYIYASLFGLLDAAKFLLPTLAAYLAFNGLKKHSRQARICYLFFAFLSGLSHIGLTLAVRDRESSDVSSSHTRLQDAIASRDGLREQIAPLKGTRSTGKISADIETIERDPVFMDPAKSARCTNDTAPDSRKLCDRWRAAKGESSDRVKLDDLTGKLEEAQKRVDALNTGGALRKANILAASVAEKTGMAESTVLLVIAIIMALGIEAGSSLLLELAAAAGHGKREARDNITDQPAMPSGAKNSDNATNNAAGTAPSLPVMCPQQWVRGNLQPKRGNLPYDTVVALYEDAAKVAGMAPATANALGRALTANGYERKRSNGKTAILGAGLVTARPALVAVK